MNDFDLDAHELPRTVTAHGDAAAIEALWAGVRLAVIDTETVTYDDEFRVVSVAVVTCRGGLVRGKWQTLVDAGVPVDAESNRVHGLTDEHLAGEPPFAQVADVLRAALTPADGETLVFVAHNVNFDASVLRSEYDRIGEQIPDLAVLDTSGPLAARVGVRPAKRSLNGLCEALGLTHARPHDALDDAQVCAEAATELLNRAAVGGDRDFDALLAEVSGDSTTRSVPDVDPRSFRQRPRAKALPVAHVEGHSEPLSARAGRRMLEQWRDQVRECAELRCRHLDDRVLNAGPKPTVLFTEVEAVLNERVTDGDVAGAATVLGALLPLIPSMAPRAGRLGFRNAQLFWARDWGPRLAALGRCGTRDRCPACRRLEPCPLDTWPDTVAAAALGDPERYARGFFETTGKEAGTGAYTQWCAKGVTGVADAAVLIALNHWRDIGQVTRSEQVAELAWNAGCRNPDVVDVYAGQLAAAGGVADLRAALAATKRTLRQRHGSTHEAWNRLQARSHQLDGQLARLHRRPSGRFNADGNSIPIRRHHPDTPRRTRPQRFRRTGRGSAATRDATSGPSTT